MMKLITIRSQILKVAIQWKKQYCSDGDVEKMKILKQLEALNLKTATAEDIKIIIGNSSWAEPQRCYECKEEHDIIIQLGEDPDYESSTTWICTECLIKALRMFIK